MKYLIIGTGGTGGCIGSFLAKARKDVTFIARGKHLQTMKKNGLKVESEKMGNFVIKPVKACTMDDYNDIPDVIFVCVKYFSIDSVNKFINKIATENTLVIPILNVFGTGEVIQNACEKPTVLDGCIYIYAMIGENGVIKQLGNLFKVYFGYRPNQKHSLEKVAKKVAKDLIEAKIAAYYTTEIKKEALKKFSYVSPVGAAGVYYDAVGGDFFEKGEKQDTFLNLVKEIEKLGEAMNITFEEDLPQVNLKILKELDKNSTTSMQRDVKKGGTSEIDGLVHRVVRLAHEYNVKLPTYEKISKWAKDKDIH